jgi:hypothetical protein
LKNRYSKLALFKDEYPNCKSDERSWVISEVISFNYLVVDMVSAMSTATVTPSPSPRPSNGITS